jgi:hypothetical protein
MKIIRFSLFQDSRKKPIGRHHDYHYGAPPRRGFSNSAGTLFSGRLNNAISVLFSG